MRDDPVLTVREAADVLGCSRQRVRQLVAGGRLSARRSGSTLLIRSGSLGEFAYRRGRPGRQLSPRMAWGAILGWRGGVLRADRLSGLGYRTEEIARLARLRDRPIDDWRWLAASRATSSRFDVWRTERLELASITPSLLGGVSASAGHGLVPREAELDLYVPSDSSALGRLESSLRPWSTGDVRIRRVPDLGRVTDALWDLGAAPRLLVGIDLVEDPDPRSHLAGRSLIADELGIAVAVEGRSH